jgi:hypothetical protein
MLLPAMSSWYSIALIPDDGASHLGRHSTGFELGNGVDIVPIPSELTRANNAVDVTWEQISLLARHPNVALIRRYEATGPSDLHEMTDDTGKQIHRSVHSRDFLRLANLSIWLVSPARSPWFTRTLDVQETPEGWKIWTWGYPGLCFQDATATGCSRMKRWRSPGH